MRKSETGTFLPTIRSHRASMEGRSKMKSFFLERVKREVGREASYEAMESSVINEQQHRLKNLLREFNQRSQSILADYISGPLKEREGSVPKMPMETSKKVLDQEEAILRKMIDQCQTELKALDSRCENLKYVTREEMQRQIQQTRQELEQLRVSNKEVGREVTLNGLNICRGQQFDQVPDLQYQRGQLELKKNQLNLNSAELAKQLEGIKEKTAASDQDMQSLEGEYQHAVGQLEGMGIVSKMKEEIREKKKEIEYHKGRNQQAAAALRQKYYTKLRDYDEFKTESQKATDLLAQREQDLGRTRKELIVLEHRLSALKHKTVTVQLLNQK